MKNNVLIIVGGLVISISLQGAAGAASDVNQTTIEMQTALAELKDDQSVFNENFIRISEEAFLIADKNILIEEESLIYEIQKALEEQANGGNHQKVESLIKMLKFVRTTKNTFSDSYQKSMSNTAVDSERDLDAINNIIANLADDLDRIRQEIAKEPGEGRKQGVIVKLAGKSNFLNQVELHMTGMPDGQQAKIFMFCDGGYYINAGTYAGVKKGMCFAVTDAHSGDYIGNLEIVYCMPSFAVAVPAHSTEMPIGSVVMGLETKFAPESWRK